MTLKHWRLARGLTQEQLANKLKIDSQFVSNIERNKAPIPPKHFRTISKVLDIPIYLLIKSHLRNEEIRIKKQIGYKR